MFKKSEESVETKERFKQLLDHGGTMLSGGVAAGVTTLASVWLLGGLEAAAIGGVIGAGVQIALRKVGAEISTRWLSPREEIRLGATFLIVAEEIMRRLENGDKLREDGFFDGSDSSRSDAEEVAESVILKVQREPEEKKIPYMGYLFSSVVFDAEVSTQLAHQIAKVAEQLTYRQLCILKLAFVKDRYSLRGRDYQGEKNITRDVYPALYECAELYNKEFINFRSQMDYGMANLVPSRMTLQGIGEDLFNLMKLTSIPDEDIAPIAEQLK